MFNMLMESEMLFLGGCEDGKWHMVENELDHVGMPQYNDDGTVTAIEYRRERIRCEGVTFAVMIEISQSMVWAIQTLLKGYKSNK